MSSMSDTAAARKFVVWDSVGFAICLTKKTILVLATTECLVVFEVIYWIQQNFIVKTVKCSSTSKMKVWFCDLFSV